MKRTRTTFVTAVAAAATIASLSGATASADCRQLPKHIFAPYFEGYTADSPAALAAASGNKYLTLAFIQTPAPGSCDIDWNGDPAAPIAWSHYGADIAKIRAAGGDVVPSFGGYGADHGQEEIADSCTDVDKIARDYESVVTTYGVTRLDFDVEDFSETNAAGVDRRNKAIKIVEDWAARTGRRVEFVYTVGTNMTGLNVPTGVNVLQNAVANHARIDIVNIMTFDYYDNKQHEMATDAKSAAAALVTTLHGLWPDKTPSQLWSMVGITAMIGLDDYGSGGETGPVEEFTPADAVDITVWGWQHGIALLSFWGLHRDNGSCPGQHQEACSGVQQLPWEYSTIMGTFTHR